MKKVNNKVINYIVRFLNDLLVKDRDAIEKLIEARVECNDAMADHDTVQVVPVGSKCFVGLLGILNGIIGINSKGDGYIMACYDSNNKLIKFELTENCDEDISMFP